MVTQTTIDYCRSLLRDAAKKGGRLTYGQLMKELGISRQQIKDCLNPIYREEIDAGRPDLTLIAHYAGKWTGLYNSRGKQAQTIVVDPGNQVQLQAYKHDLSEVYREWGGKPQGKLKEWLES